ncbi:MAG TPA: DoxX family protein [Muricauda sp.]|uniref:DoxX family membrane protein n=1 Tax=Flagellimonas abyssi TaxID=2864871 RepID=A0ABS7EQX5_9FLAO|nr:DoxX family membrane protein [Allomuricauda abyssi]MBW8199988.1 DoxX family membrane protein [Allomuricauda abyssi]HBU77490.1 DoxX family protein [Allomuricauda sp.]|tara:strand:+ start:1844 stop:2221 length:378 start_codon:yes stop_codon:yes gene_type:complete
MNSKVFMVIRILLGLFVIIFGANKLYPFLPAPEEMPEGMMTYFTGLTMSKTLILVGLVEVLAGISFILNKYGALMAIILMSVSVCAVLFHLTMAMESIAPALALLILNIVVLVGYKDRYKDILRP